MDQFWHWAKPIIRFKVDSRFITRWVSGSGRTGGRPGTYQLATEGYNMCASIGYELWRTLHEARNVTWAEGGCMRHMSPANQTDPGSRPDRRKGQSHVTRISDWVRRTNKDFWMNDESAQCWGLYVYSKFPWCPTILWEFWHVLSENVPLH